MFSPLFAIFICFLTCSTQWVRATDKDEHDSCAYWASTGECTKNPGYMLVSCKASCNALSSTKDKHELASSFYDITETDLNGGSFSFSNFKGKVVYLINVASHCGYTAENYAKFRDLKKFESQGFVMVLAPCNSFGFQEPGDSVAIRRFAGDEGFSGIILSKADVNGPETRPSFQCLKHAAQVHHINWYGVDLNIELEICELRN